jgi:hypothetical protein
VVENPDKPDIPPRCRGIFSLFYICPPFPSHRHIRFIRMGTLRGCANRIAQATALLSSRKDRARQPAIRTEFPARDRQPRIAIVEIVPVRWTQSG